MRMIENDISCLMNIDNAGSMLFSYNALIFFVFISSMRLMQLTDHNESCIAMER